MRLLVTESRRRVDRRPIVLASKDQLQQKLLHRITVTHNHSKLCLLVTEGGYNGARVRSGKDCAAIRSLASTVSSMYI